MNKKQTSGSRLDFFRTVAGRRLVFYAAGATTCTLFVGNFLPHTLLLKYYQDFVTCYQNGIARPVPPQIQKRIETALDKLQLEPHERKLVKPFTVFGFDLFQAGTTRFRFGAALGIPVNYAYESVNDIKRADIRFRDKAIDWNSESGKLLEEAIVLTEDEQLFGLCKIIMEMQTQRVLMNSIFPSVSFLMVYTVGQYLNLRLNLFAKHISVRLVLYSILGLFGLGSWSFMKDFNQVSYEAEIDKKLAQMGPEFVKAGMGFYDKQLKKNIALRNLIGDNTYTAMGNENYVIRQKSLPLTAHKMYFQEKIEELKQCNTAAGAEAAAATQ